MSFKTLMPEIWAQLTAEQKAETEEAEAEEKTDVFYAQQQALDTLTDLFMRQDQDKKITYVSPPVPLPPAKNYLLYIGLGLGILYLTGRIKL